MKPLPGSAIDDVRVTTASLMRCVYDMTLLFTVSEEPIRAGLELSSPHSRSKHGTQYDYTADAGRQYESLGTTKTV